MSAPKYPYAIGYKGDLPAGRNKVVRAPSIRERTLAVIERGDASSEDIAKEIGEHFCVVRGRASELRAMGLIDATGRRGNGALGGQSTIWRATTPLERAAFVAAREAAQ